MRQALAVLVALLIVVGGAGAVYARDGHGGGHSSGGHFGGHGGSFHSRGGGEHFRGGHFGGGHFRGHGRVFIGVGPSVYWGPGWGPYWGGPSYAYTPPVVVQEPPAVYVERPYWYYCQSARAYYPYVNGCPEGWLRVAPQ